MLLVLSTAFQRHGVTDRDEGVFLHEGPRLLCFYYLQLALKLRTFHTLRPRAAVLGPLLNRFDDREVTVAQHVHQRVLQI